MPRTKQLTAELIRDKWGAEGFATVPRARLETLPLRAEDKEILAKVGLPERPKESLELNLRCENVKLKHSAKKVTLLNDETSFERCRRYPKTGNKELDAKVDLSTFVILGRGPNGFRTGEWAINRFICLDGMNGTVYWIYPKLRRGRTQYCRINSSLRAYLQSLLAYKLFRDKWQALLDELGDVSQQKQKYTRRANTIWNRFMMDLEAADPVDFEKGFWHCHAFNEQILLFSVW